MLTELGLECYNLCEETLTHPAVYLHHVVMLNLKNVTVLTWCQSCHQYAPSLLISPQVFEHALGVPIRYSLPSQEDSSHLPLSLYVNQLTLLNLSAVAVFHFSSGTIHVLLQIVTATLTILRLEGCKMKVSQVSALLPALGQCTQLLKIKF